MNKVIKNIIYQSSYQLLTLILPLITVPYVARVLGPSLVGTYSYTSTVSNYFVLFGMLGLSSHGSRVIAREQTRAGRSKAFADLVFAHSFVAVPVFLSYLVYMLTVGSELLPIYIAQAFTVLGSCVDISWLYFGVEEFRFTVIRNFVVKIVTAACVFLFVKNDGDFLLYVLIMSLGTFLGIAALWLSVGRYVDFAAPSFRSAIDHLKPMTVLFVAVIATNVYHTIGKLFLGNASAMEGLGCFEYADRLIQIPVALITSFGTVMLPRMTSLYSSGDIKSANRYLKLSIEAIAFFAVGLACGLVVIREPFVNLFLGEGYSLTADLLLPMAPAILFIALANVIRSQYIIPNGLDRIYLIAVVLAAVVNVVSNLLLIPQVGAMGAAVSSSAAYVVVFLVQTIMLIKKVSFRSILTSCLPAILSGAAALIVLTWVEGFFAAEIQRFLVSFLGFIGIYFVFSIMSIRLNKKSELYDVIRAHMPV